MTFSCQAKGRVGRRPHDDLSAGHALADVVVGLTLQHQAQAGGAPGAEALAGAPLEAQLDGARREALEAVTAGDLAGDAGADGEVAVADGGRYVHRLAPFDGGEDLWEELLVQRRIGSVVALLNVAPRRDVGRVDVDEDGVPGQAAAAMAGGQAAGHQQVHPADDVVQAGVAQDGQDVAHLLGHEGEVVDDHLRRAAKAPLDEVLALRGDAGGTGVEVALAGHVAAQGDDGRRAEAELLGAQHRGHHHVAAGLDAAVGAQADATAQAVEHQHLLRLGQAQLPGAAGVLDRGERRGAGAAVHAADLDVVGVGLGDARRDGADAALGHQLDADASARVGLLQVVDELGQVFDAVDVVVRRRRDERDAGDGVADAGDELGHLVAGELAALAGLGTLRDLDLELVGHGQVLGGHPEAGGRHLLDSAVGRIAVVQRLVPAVILAALAGVAAGAHAVHGQWPGSCGRPG